MSLSRATLPAYDHDAVLAELTKRWETRPGAPAAGEAGPWRLSELCAAGGCPTPALIQPATDALGVALGDHHILRARPMTDVTPLDQGGSGRLDAIDAELWIIDVAAASPELRRMVGIR